MDEIDLASDVTRAIRLEISKIFIGDEDDEFEWDTVALIVERALDLVREDCIRNFVGPSPVIHYHEPPRPPHLPLLKKFILHTNEVTKTTFTVTSMETCIPFTAEERGELLRLEAEAIRDIRGDCNPSCI